MGTSGQGLLIRQEALGGLGRGGGGGLHTHVHTQAHMGVSICLQMHVALALESWCDFRGIDGDFGILRPQGVLQITLFSAPCTPSTPCQDSGCALWLLQRGRCILICVHVHILGTVLSGPPHAEEGSALHLTCSKHLITRMSV